MFRIKFRRENWIILFLLLTRLVPTSGMVAPTPTEIPEQYEGDRIFIAYDEPPFSTRTIGAGNAIES